MSENQPLPITKAEERARFLRVTGIARVFGFVGLVEYRHAFSKTGGAQFGLGRSPQEDILVVFAEAFVRDANPEDYSLEAIIAHERGHQILFRNTRLGRMIKVKISERTEEMLASLIGSLLVSDTLDRDKLITKAAGEIVGTRYTSQEAYLLALKLRMILRSSL